MVPDRQGRFWVFLGSWLVATAALAGAATTLQAGVGLSRFGGLEYVPRVVALSVVRVLGAGITFTSGLLAWITWTHGWDESMVRASFSGTARRAALSSPVTYLIAVVVALSVSVGISATMHGKPPGRSVAAITSTVTGVDLLVGFATTIAHSCVLVTLSWFVMPWLARTGWRLPSKIFLVWTVNVLLHLAIALVGR